LILFIIAILAVLCLLKTAEPVALVTRQSGEPSKKATTIDLGRITAEYKGDVKRILADYYALTEAADFTVTQLKSVKNQLLELRVPTAFKDLHINFVLAVTKMENFLKTGKLEEKTSSQALIDEILLNYSWLK